MSEHQHEGDYTRPELQLFQQRRSFLHSVSAPFPFARHIDGKRMGITDPTAASIGCNLPTAQLYQGLPCPDGSLRKEQRCLCPLPSRMEQGWHSQLRL